MTSGAPKSWNAAKPEPPVSENVKHYNDEYHLLDGSPFLAHQRGSKNHNLRNNVHSDLFYDRCEQYIKGNLK